MFALESLKKGFEVAKGSLLLVIILSVYNFITSAAMLGVIGINPTPEKVAQISGLILFLFIATMALWILLEGGLFSAITSKIKTNQLQLDSFITNCFKFFGRLLGINFISGLIVGGIWFIAAILSGVFIALGQGKNPFFNAIGLILFVVALLFSGLISFALLMGHYILIAENGKVMASLKKSFSLFKEYFGRILLLFTLVVLIFLASSFIVNAIGWLFGKILPAGWFLVFINVTLTSLVNGAVSIFASCSLITLVLSLTSQPAQSAQPAQPAQPEDSGETLK